MRERRIPLLLLALYPGAIFAQLLSDADMLDRMRNDVRYLSSDALEGREAGTPGERMAVDYIASKFGNLGLMPYGDSATYLQAFQFQADPILGSGNALQLGRSYLKADEDFAVLPFSGNGVVRGKVLRAGYGIQAEDLGTDDYQGLDPKGKVLALSISSPDGIHPHSKYLAHHDLRARVQRASELGAVAVVLYNDDPTAQDPDLRLSSKIKPCDIPVVYLKGERDRELLQTNNPAVVEVDIIREQRTAYNVVGLLDLGKPDVVVIGAHLDHLGWGDEGSLHRGERAIHNGADDNASGIAVMLALASDLAELPHLRANNYLFIAFSGEEKGLFGSNHWTKHPTLPIERLNYMINLDMVGRLDTNTTIGVNGVGTSPAWAEIDPLRTEGLQAKTTTSGIGPSDHTSFYLQGVPAVHFFTGAHADYHKPSDDFEKVDIPGMLRITRYIEALIASLDDNGKIPFNKTEEADQEQAPRFKVTLGVVPDYLYDGSGMRIDGVTEGKPASNAGLQAGDVVLRLGAVEVLDMMAYMKGLSQFEKGDSARIVILREGKEIETTVTF